MLNKILLSALLVLSHSTPAFAQSMKFSRPDIVESQDSKVNYVKNPSGFKNALDVTTSSATIAQDLTGSSDLLDGVASLVCDASAQNGYCEWDSKTIQEGDKTGNCEAKAVFKGDASLYKLQIHDGSNVLASSSVLSNATDWTSVSVNYPCGSTRKVRLTQTESGTGAAVNIGRVYWGPSTNLGLANPIGPWVSWTPTGGWASNAVYTGKKRQIGDSYEYDVTIDVGGAVSGDLTINLPSGDVIDTTKLATAAGTGASKVVGTASMLVAGARYYTGSAVYQSTTAIYVINSESGNTGIVNGSNPATFAATDFVSVRFIVPIVGLGTQAVVNNNLSPWYVDATIEGGNPSMGSSTQASYIGIEDSALTMTPRTGSAPVAIMCSSTNSAASPTTGTSVCSSGAESVSANFSIPKAGTYEACFYGSHFMANDSGEEADVDFQIIETPTNAQTLTLEGGTKTESRLTSQANGTQVSHPLVTCSYFNWSSSGIKGIRLMYEQTVNGTPNSNILLMDASTSNGQRNGRWTVTPVTAQSPAPLLVGSVTSNSSRLERIERALLNCDASSAITSQSGSWVSSIGNISSNRCTVTLASGIFSATPVCTASVTDSSINTVYSTNMNVASSTSITIGCVSQSGASTTACSAADFNVICQGPR